MKAALEFTEQALVDWKRLDVERREQIARVLESMRAESPPENLDTKALKGARPWKRLRVGSHRVIFRAMVAAELRRFGTTRGFLVSRVIDRRDLERATQGLR